MMKSHHKIKRKANRVQRACYNCRKRKQGCEEERPCRRCVDKGIECVEVEPKRKRGRAKGTGGHCHDNPNSPGSSVEMDGNEGEGYYEDDSAYSSEPELAGELETTVFKDDIPSSPPSSPAPFSDDEDEDEPELEPTKNPQLSICSIGGLNVALLLPFLYNNDLTAITGERDARESLNSKVEDYAEDPLLSSSPPDFIVGSPGGSDWESLLQKEVYGFDYPFYHNHNSNSNFNGRKFEVSSLTPTNSMEFMDENMEVVDDVQPALTTNCVITGQFTENWNFFLSRLSQDDTFKKEFSHARELWKEIMNGLRTLDWQRVQMLLREMDPFDDPLSPPTVFWSSGGRIHYANPAFCKLVGYSLEELRAVPDGKERIRAYSLFQQEEMVKINCKQLEAVQNPDMSSYQVKTRLISKIKQELRVQCSISNLRDPLGTTLLTMAHFSPDSLNIPIPHL